MTWAWVIIAGLFIYHVLRVRGLKREVKEWRQTAKLWKEKAEASQGIVKNERMKRVVAEGDAEQKDEPSG